MSQGMMTGRSDGDCSEEGGRSRRSARLGNEGCARSRGVNCGRGGGMRNCCRRREGKKGEADRRQGRAVGVYRLKIRVRVRIEVA